MQFNAGRGFGIMKDVNRKFFAVVALLLVLVFSVGAEVLRSTRLCDLKDARINESSGLAASRRYAAQGLLWTHNDSGDTSRLFCINQQGETVAEVLLKGASNIDWEDIAVTAHGIYVADIGDNARRRKNIVIYHLPEPQLNAAKTEQTLTLPCETMTLRYPDGARDAETSLVDGKDEVVIVTKNFVTSRIYKTPQPFKNGIAQMLKPVGEYSFVGNDWRGGLTTGGDISPDGKRLIIRTYTRAYEWKIPERNDWKSLWKTKPRALDLPESKQGESICFSADGTKYFLTSEGVPTPLFCLAASNLK